MTVNEPEWAPRFFHVPERLRDVPKVPLIREVQPGHERTPDGDAYRQSFGIHSGAMASILRMAIDDVAELLHVSLRLSGPTSNQFFKVLSTYGGDSLDILDFHHYSDEAESHQLRIDEATVLCHEIGEKSLAISEFNLRAGPTPFEKMMFVMPAALANAQVLMTAIQAADEHVPLDYLALYLFAGPSTHRSFKHLVYGDLNMLSWDSLDTALRAKGDAWYPTFDELQLRHCTPAYHVFKALSRALATMDPGDVESAEDARGVILRDSSGTEPYVVMTAERGDELFVHYINPLDADALAAVADHQLDKTQEQAAKNTLVLELPQAPGERWAIVRRTATGMADQLLAVIPVPADGKCRIPDAPQSFTQIRITRLNPAEIQSIRLQELTHTPGTSGSLGLFQTIRLRAIDEAGRDVSDSLIQWQSSQPHVVAVSSTGLVQRLRDDTVAVEISARVFGTDACVSTQIS